MKTLTFYETTILDAISLDGREIKDEANMKTLDKLKAVYEIFLSEYIHEYNEHIPREHLFKEWMMGLPSALEVPFMNHEILSNVTEWGFNMLSEEVEDSILSTYWERCAKAFFTLKDNL
jgi:hypothetical protein